MRLLCKAPQDCNGYDMIRQFYFAAFRVLFVVSIIKCILLPCRAKKVFSEETTTTLAFCLTSAFVGLFRAQIMLKICVKLLALIVVMTT